MSGGGYTNPWEGATITQGWLFKPQMGIEFSYLVDVINDLTAIAKSKIEQIRSKKSAMSIADMFDLQMAMNKLTQFSEMSTAVVQAINQSINSMSRGIKGG